jgi:hypothetical protein
MYFCLFSPRFPIPMLSLLPLLLIVARTFVRADTAINPGFPYGSQKVRGVNLGGWLVLEPWITPSLFDNTGDSRVVDEWTFCQFAPNAQSVLTNHWNTWITESDFAAIAAAGYVEKVISADTVPDIALKPKSRALTYWLLGV